MRWPCPAGPLPGCLRGAPQAPDRSPRGSTWTEVWQGSIWALRWAGSRTCSCCWPNLGTGHSSAFSILEAQLAYVVDAVRALRTTVYNAVGCSSYYLDTNGRNSFSWPWSTPALSRRIKDFDPDSYLEA
jgi:hypothetical protein